jgi:hypothetical protein
MTVEGNGIKCDVVGCPTQSEFEGSRMILPPESVRVRYSMLGWRFHGDEQPLDICPRHF